ncbi:uncharacterized protein LOC124263061 [Haliotis rubra]|uniref:uncharacterized protein LOC124263061 n=1 Tax=Haliotis rubra TaxID=36100 RepID=UPI001EE5643F|nr:uncharacterized protein LOC124263061 [Haliotis rubra]XP_046553631.1 uncharacterized protein LOC124263061 [Haliotis rubra]
MLQQILESTKQYITHFDAAKHVSTYAERTAMRILEQSGAIYMTGKSGSGKTRIGLAILAAISEKTDRIPIILTSAKQWNYIPQGNVGKDSYTIMIDDIFGSWSVVNARVDEWSRRFDIMWPTVESGQVLLVLVSRSGIGAHHMPSLQKYKIIRNAHMIDLDEGPYALRYFEKVKLVRKYCAMEIGASQEDIEKIVGEDTPLGFPQCCIFLHTTRHTHVKGLQFFKRPYEFIAEDVEVLKETDQLGYYVLLMIIVMNNSLDIKLLNNPTAEFNRLRENIRNACTYFTSNPSCQKLKEKADLLCGKYLSETGQRYTFRHQSILEAVVLNAAEENKELFLRYCPVQTLLEFVSLRTDCSNVSLCIKQEEYRSLVSRVTDIILSENCSSILSHSAFHHPRFLECLSDEWNDDVILQISSYAATPHNLTLTVANMKIFHMFSDPLSFFGSQFRDEEVIFTYKYAVSFFIMQRLPVLVKLVLHGVDQQEVKEEALKCALYIQDHATIDFLLQQEVTISQECMTIICCIRDVDQSITNTICHHFEDEHEVLSSPEKLLSLAVQHGNIRAVQFLVKKMSGLTNCGKIYFRCLEQLMVQCDMGNRSVPPISSNAIPVLEIMTILMSVQTPSSYHHLLLSASAHDTTLALEWLLNHTDAPVITADMEEVMEMVATHGISDNLSILLKKGIPFKKTILLGATKSRCQSGGKIVLLLEAFRKAVHAGSQLQGNENSDRGTFGVNVEDENKNNPLHIAALRGDADSVGVLLGAGADISHVNKDGLTPLQCATLAGSTECVKCLLQSVKKRHTECSDSIELVSPAHVWHDGSFKSFPSLNTLRFLLMPNSTGSTPKALLDLLLGQAMYLETTDEYGRTPMFYASALSDLPLIKHLLRLGAKLDVQDCNGRTVLHEAARHADIETFMLLCESGCEIDVKTSTSQTVVHEAAESRDNVKTPTGQTVVHEAAESRVDVKTPTGQTVVHEAAESRDDVKTSTGQTVVHEAAESRDDVKTPTGQTVVHEAAESRDGVKTSTGQTVAQEAAESRVDVKTSTGQTVVHEAAESRDDVKTSTGQTVVHEAAESRDGVKTSTGQTVVHEAAESRDGVKTSTGQTVAQEAAESRVDVKTSTGQTVVHEAAESRDDVKTSTGQTVVHEAAESICSVWTV